MVSQDNKGVSVAIANASALEAVELQLILAEIEQNMVYMADCFYTLNVLRKIISSRLDHTDRDAHLYQGTLNDWGWCD